MIEIDLSKLFKPKPPQGSSWGVLEWLNTFMDRCTHAGVERGVACPLCGRVVT